MMPFVGCVHEEMWGREYRARMPSEGQRMDKPWIVSFSCVPGGRKHLFRMPGDRQRTGKPCMMPFSCMQDRGKTHLLRMPGEPVPGWSSCTLEPSARNAACRRRSRAGRQSAASSQSAHIGPASEVRNRGSYRSGSQVGATTSELPEKHRCRLQVTRQWPGITLREMSTSYLAIMLLCCKQACLHMSCSRTARERCTC
jgi:hypothetical protein